MGRKEGGESGNWDSGEEFGTVGRGGSGKNRKMREDRGAMEMLGREWGTRGRSRKGMGVVAEVRDCGVEGKFREGEVGYSWGGGKEPQGHLADR